MFTIVKTFQSGSLTLWSVADLRACQVTTSTSTTSTFTTSATTAAATVTTTIAGWCSPTCFTVSVHVPSASNTYSFDTTKTTRTTHSSNSIPVCDPANNYGLLYDGGSESTPYGTDFHQEAVPGAQTIKDCCISCFSTKGCEVFSFLKSNSKSPCGLHYYQYYLGTDGPNPYNPTCPYGNTIVTGFSDDPNNGVGPYLGYGPCATTS